MADSNDVNVSHCMQAETLAEHLAPLLERYDVKWRGHGYIYVDHEHYNIETLHKILRDLSSALGVSEEAIRLRLIEEKWLNDVRDKLPRPEVVRRPEDHLRYHSYRDTDADDYEIDRFSSE